MLKEECLDLPEKVFVKRTVELSDEQQKDLQTNETCMALAELDDGKMMSTVCYDTTVAIASNNLWSH